MLKKALQVFEVLNHMLHIVRLLCFQRVEKYGIHPHSRGATHICIDIVTNHDSHLLVGLAIGQRIFKNPWVRFVHTKDLGDDNCFKILLEVAVFQFFLARLSKSIRDQMQMIPLTQVSECFVCMWEQVSLCGAKGKIFLFESYWEQRGVYAKLAKCVGKTQLAKRGLVNLAVMIQLPNLMIVHGIDLDKLVGIAFVE